MEMQPVSPVDLARRAADAMRGAFDLQKVGLSNEVVGDFCPGPTPTPPASAMY